MNLVNRVVSLFLNDDDTPNWTRITAALVFIMALLLLVGGAAVAAMRPPQTATESAQVVESWSPTATTLLIPTIAATVTPDVVSPVVATDVAVATAAAATEIAAATQMALAAQPNDEEVITQPANIPPTATLQSTLPTETPLPLNEAVEEELTPQTPVVIETPTPELDAFELSGTMTAVSLAAATETTTQPDATESDATQSAATATRTPIPTRTPRPTVPRSTSAEDDISRELTATRTRTPTPPPDATPTRTRTPRPSRTPQPDSTPIPPIAVDLSPFGVEVNRGAVSNINTYLQELHNDGGVSWVRYNGLVWPEIEAARGERFWSTTDESLTALVEAGVEPMVIIRGTPDWAQQEWDGNPPQGARCSPIRRDELDAFADFVGDAVERYSQAPYNVRYWEIGNEPDVDPQLVSDELGFGCWGDSDDQYYGGGYYAEMLKQVYPAIKAANPDAIVVLGGLLLDCDPTNPQGKDCTPARFLEGILDNGGGNSFDVVAYHGYAYWLSSEQDSDRNLPAWQHRGGAMLGKLDFIQEVLQEYNVEKPIIVNEMGLLCYPNTACDPARNDEQAIQNFLDAQASYVIRGYLRAWGNNLQSAAWYTLDDPNWRQAGLLEENDTPRTGYESLLFLSGLLENASFVEKLGDGTVLEGYAFTSGSTRYDIYWTNDGSSVDVTLPSGAHTIYDKTGDQRSPSGTSVTVTFDPVIIAS